MRDPQRIHEERAVSPIVGIALLFGLVAIASLSFFVIGTSLITESEQQLEQERVENAFVELSHSIGSEASDPGMGTIVELDAGDHGVITKENTATMEVTADNLDGAVGFDIGTVEWESDDGTTIAYQGGGVFRETGEETQLVSSPSINYDLDSETLTMPVYNVTGEENLHSGPVRLDQDSVDQINQVAYMQEDNVTIHVESEYYMGWKQYFEDQAGDTIVTDYGSIDGDYGYVEAELGYIDFDDDVFSDGVSYSGECDGQGGGGGGDSCDQHGWEVSEGDPSQPMDSVVDQMINNPEEANNQSFDDVIGEGESIEDEFENEFVLIDRDLDGDDVEVSLEHGNATLAVDGDIRDTDITVTDNVDDHTLQIYLNGSYLNNGEDVCVDDCIGDGTTIQIFGTSETAIQFGTGGQPTFEGLFYAASDEAEWDHLDGSGVCSASDQLCVQATPDIYGGVVVNSANIQGGGSVSIEHDPEIDAIDVDFREELMPPQITFLNVVEHRINLENQ